MPGYFVDSLGNVFKPESIISESPTYEVNIPQRPVPLGDVTQDHGQIMPMKMSVVLDVTQVPWEGREMFYQISYPPAQLDEDVTDDDGELVVDFGADLGETSIRAGISGDATADVLAIRWFEAVRGERIAYYSTKFDPMYVCMVKSFSTMRTNSQKLRITVLLEMVIVAQAQTVALPPRTVKPKKADDKNTKGDQPAGSEPGNPKQAETAFTFIDKVLGLGLTSDNTSVSTPKVPKKVLSDTEAAAAVKDKTASVKFFEDQTRKFTSQQTSVNQTAAAARIFGP